MCFMCCDRNCYIDCYYNVGRVCKYGIFEPSGVEPECSPEQCECRKGAMIT
jgi:hypothetical protein